MLLRALLVAACVSRAIAFAPVARAASRPLGSARSRAPRALRSLPWAGAAGDARGAAVDGAVDGTLALAKFTVQRIDDYTGGGTLTELAATPVFAVLLVRLSVLYGNGKVPVLLDLGIVAVILAFVAIFLWEAGAI
jgi:hypothetical protein